MSTDTETKNYDKLLTGIKNNYLPLDAIYGVDLEKGTVTHHPDMYQPKPELRRDVIESVKLAKSADMVPPIEIYVLEDGSVGVVDGYNRLTAFVEYCAENPNADKFRKIRVMRFIGGLDDVEFAAVRQNLETGRSNMTQAEEIMAFERFLQKGYTSEDINEKLGGSKSRYVKQLNDILMANPVVATAVKAGKVSVESATKIARHVPIKNQPAKVEEVAKAEATAKISGKSSAKIRQEAGLRASKPGVMKINEIYNYMHDWFPTYVEQVNEGPEAIDEDLAGQFKACCTILKVNDKSASAKITYFTEIMDGIDAAFAKKNAPRAPKAEKVKPAKAPKPVKTAPVAKSAKATTNGKVEKDTTIVVNPRPAPTAKVPIGAAK